MPSAPASMAWYAAAKLPPGARISGRCMQSKVTPAEAIVNRRLRLRTSAAAATIRLMRPSTTLAAFLATLALASCATQPPGMRGVPTQRPALSPATDAIRAKLGEGAAAMVGAKELVVNGRRFSWDCTGHGARHLLVRGYRPRARLRPVPRQRG